MGPLAGPQGPPRHVRVVREWDYSRATTASLGDDVDAVELVGRHAPTPLLGTAVKGRRPSTPAPHMQLLVLEYGAAHGKGVDGAPGTASAASWAPPWSVASDVRSRLASSALRTPPGHAGEAADEDGDEDGDDREQSAVPADEHQDAFANAMRFQLRVGQVLSVLPVDVMTGSWSRPRAAYAVVVNVGLCLLAVLSIALQLTKATRPNLVEFMVVVFYSMASVTSWLFFRLGRRWWAALLRGFRRQERLHGPCPGLRRKLVTISGVLLVVSFVEHCLSEMNIVLQLWREHPGVSTFSECLEVYYSANYPMVVMVVGYWSFTAPFAFMLNFVATFLWNFNDVFVMSMGVALSCRFRLLRDSITLAVGDAQHAKVPVLTAVGGSVATPRVLGTAYWRSARRTFNSLSKLGRLVDQALNVQLFVSFLNNLYFICMQLLRGFDDPTILWYESVYIFFSFGLLVVRTSAVCLLTASVFEHSRSVQEVLYCVCSEDYNEEVYRFLVQVTTQDVALTGLNMFKVTRGLLLTVAGTILTYEVVLVQLT